MKRLFYLLPFALFFVACSNSMIDTSSIEKKVTSMEEDASKLRQVYDNVIQINDNMSEIEKKVEEAKSQDVLETIKKLNTEYEAFRDLIDTTSIKRIKEQTEKKRDIFLENRPLHKKLNTEARELEKQINNHIEITQKDDNRTVTFTHFKDGLIHTSHYNGDGIRTSENIYNNGQIVETKEYSTNGVNVIKSTKYNDQGQIESVIEYYDDGSKKSQIFYADGEPTGSFDFGTLAYETLTRNSFQRLGKDITVDLPFEYSLHIFTSRLCTDDEPMTCSFIASSVELFNPVGKKITPTSTTGCEDVYEMIDYIGPLGREFFYNLFDDQCKPKCALMYLSGYSTDITDYRIGNIDCPEESKKNFKDFLLENNMKVIEKN